MWFRQDLRLNDNPALAAAIQTGRPILPIYIFDNEPGGNWRIGSASRWWLNNSLLSLNHSLDNKLCFLQGNAQKILPQLTAETGARKVFLNKIYEPFQIESDKLVSKVLATNGIDTSSYNGSFLHEPGKILKDDGTPYKVFTAFYKKGYGAQLSGFAEPLPAPGKILLFKYKDSSLRDLDIMPRGDWHQKFVKLWQPGESGANTRFEKFLTIGLSHYRTGRDFPSHDNVSRLSPHIHFGEISTTSIWHCIKATMAHEKCEVDAEHFLRELVWREFSANLLYHFPDMPWVNLLRKFDNFDWNDDADFLEKWKKGQTGFPIVDAGMRELWQTGYMHNRVRMITASFLVKNLLVRWHHGEDWFWDTLLDADLANNSASWQWVAGCGADAAPFFRIFNPVTQGQKFDAEGSYVRQFIPEISKLPDRFIHCPWQAPTQLIASLGIRLGTDYPLPIVDLKVSRETALAEFKRISVR